MRQRIILLGVVVAFCFLVGCLNLTKKQCNDKQCIMEALKKCEPAVLEADAIGTHAKSEVSSEGSKCKLEESVSSSSGKKLTGAVCYYDMPVDMAKGSCTYTK